jgi:hypothetical protein
LNRAGTAWRNADTPHEHFPEMALIDEALHNRRAERATMTHLISHGPRYGKAGQEENPDPAGLNRARAMGRRPILHLSEQALHAQQFLVTLIIAPPH